MTDKTFSKVDYDYASYAAKRPSYPPTLIDFVLSETTGPRDHLLDLGCGHGVATRAFAPHFGRATGTDPSPGMLAAAAAAPTPANVTWARGTSTDFPATVAPGSVDVVIAGQAAHWFAWPETWTALAGVVRSGGTAALWGYSDPVLAGSGAATDALHRWAWGADAACLGSFWVWPGRGVVERLYADVAGAAAGMAEWRDVRWVRRDPRAGRPWYAGEERVRPGAAAEAAEAGVEERQRELLRMTRRMSVGEFKAFMRTWSAYNWWKEAHPDDRARADGGRGDVADWAMDEVGELEPEWKGDDKEILVEWPVGLVIARRA